MFSWKFFTTSLALSAAATNILVTNDDGWAVAQIRAEFNALAAAGHNVSFCNQDRVKTTDVGFIGHFVCAGR